MKYLRISLYITLLALSSCFSNNYELLGEKKVQGTSNLYFRIYQKDAFEHHTPLEFELFNESGVVISRKHLTGTDVSKENIDRFYAKLENSIFYICYPYPKVYFIQHLDTSMSYLSHSELFNVIKSEDSKLEDANN